MVWVRAEVRGEIHPSIPAPRPFSCVFGGTLGYAQDLGCLLNAAACLRDIDIQFLLVGDGPAKREAMSYARSLPNVRFLPFMAPAEYETIARKADIGVVVLKRGISSIPSKVGTFFAMGLPVAAALDGDGAMLVGISGAGIRVPAGDSEGLARVIAGLAACPSWVRQAMAENALTFARTYLSPELAFDRWDQVIAELVGDGQSSLQSR